LIRSVTDEEFEDIPKG